MHLSSSDLHTFTRWRLAFEVELKLVDATEISLSEIILKRLDREHHRTFKQLVIDFSCEYDYGQMKSHGNLLLF